VSVYSADAGQPRGVSRNRKCQPDATTTLPSPLLPLSSGEQALSSSIAITIPSVVTILRSHVGAIAHWLHRGVRSRLQRGKARRASILLYNPTCSTLRGLMVLRLPFPTAIGSGRSEDVSALPFQSPPRWERRFPSRAPLQDISADATPSRVRTDAIFTVTAATGVCGCATRGESRAVRVSVVIIAGNFPPQFPISPEGERACGNFVVAT